MTQLAIKGHPTRGKEIIKILESLGGKNKQDVGAVRETCIYFIDENTISFLKINQVIPEQFIIFTIEEFLEKFPYKVGDKVKNARINDFIGRIINIRWDNNEEQIIYTVEWNDATKSMLTYFARGLQPYKEKTINKINKAVFDANAQCCNIMNNLIMTKDYLTTNIELQSTKAELAYEIAQKELEEINKLTTEVDFLKFIAIKLVEITQKLNKI